ncbi:hypothetical protein L873DRAFT_1934092 [Choiromyces venosus 120613-1]|uniref:Uncharacterized protein n=1 Tax=Choiromyces venosus 120613-1 TaxID=1336337 RepID=A0A3N4JME2_9PEZI|nr:hypothetical protein L873DRAFT_1934092 [Choiromyces venosus 120613-1]
MPVRHVPESPRCQLSNGTFYDLLASVPAELLATIEMVFTGEFLLTLKTDISTSSHSLMPAKYVPEFPQCQHSNGASHGLLVSVRAGLQAAMQMVFTGEFLPTLKTDISTPSNSPAPIRHVPESPRCQPSNGTSHILLASVSAELQAAIEMVFTSKFLLSLKTDISTSSYLLTPVRHVPESPQCQLSNATSHVLLASVSAELQVAMEMVFTSKFPLSSKTDISMPSYSLTPAKYVPEFPRCQLFNDAFLDLLASVPARYLEAQMFAHVHQTCSRIPSMPAFQRHLLRPPGISSEEAIAY